MKQLPYVSLLMLGMMIAFTGCDATKENLDKATEAGTELAKNAQDLTKIVFGDFDMTGLQETFSGITEGFKSLSADNVDALTSQLSGLGASMDTMGLADLSGPAKTAVMEAIGKFADAIKSAMDGVSDESLLSKLKPVVDPILEKIKALK